MIAAVQRANQMRAHAATYKTHAAGVFTPPQWAAAPGDRAILEGSTVKTSFDVGSLHVFPLQVGEQTFTAESVKNDATILAIAQGVSPTSAKVLALDPTDSAGSAHVWAPVGTVVHFEGAVKTIKLHPVTSDAVLEALQGNAPLPVADPNNPGAQAAAIVDARTSPTTRSDHGQAQRRMWLFDTLALFNGIYYPGHPDSATPGLLDTFVKNHLNQLAPGIFRDIQNGRIDSKTNVLSAAKVTAYLDGVYGDGANQVSVADFNLTRETIARAHLTVPHVLARFETYRRFVTATNGPVYAAAVEKLFKDIRDVLYFDDEEGDRLLVVLEGFLNMANDVVALPAIPDGFTARRHYLFQGLWNVTWNSRHIQEYIQSWTQKRMRSMEAAASQHPPRSYAAAAASNVSADPNSGSAKRPKTDTRRPAAAPSTYSRDTRSGGSASGGAAPAPRLKVTKEQHDEWMAKKPAWLPPGERVMCRAVASGRPCPLGRNCRSNDAYTVADPARMAEVKAWAADSPYGK